MKKISVWQATAQQTSFPPLTTDEEADIAIVGGGITGITAAYLLSEQGKSVVLLESERIGESATGYSTGNLYATVSAGLFNIKSSFDEETSRAVAESRSAAVDLIEQLTGKFNIACEFGRHPWHLFSQGDSNISTIEKENEAAQKAGLNSSIVHTLPLPFSINTCVKIEGQAQFNPMEYIKALAKGISNTNCRIYEKTRVTEIKKGDPCILKTPTSEIKAKKVILATHIPVGVYNLHSMLFPYREDGIAVKLNGEYPPEGIFWELYETTHHSFRTYNSPEGTYLVVVGEPYKTGQQNDTYKGFEGLEEYARKKFDVATVEYRWAAQSYQAANKLPYIGELEENIFTGTGFSTDGLTYGTLAAMILADTLTGKDNKWFKTYDLQRHNPFTAAGSVIKENLNVLGQYLKDLPGIAETDDLSEIKPGEGKVIATKSEKIAVYRDENDQIHAVSAVCTHMDCIVNWNTAEKTWDCPCHGSRFKINGEVIEGPALKPLENKNTLIDNIES